MLNIEKYFKIFRMDEIQVLKYMGIFLRSQGYKGIIANEDFIFAPGELPVLLVAHADTVHKQKANKWNKGKTPQMEIFHDRENTMLWSPQGLGADDRAGVIAILETVKGGLKPHVLITTGEETGGTGASEFCRREHFKMQDIRFMLEVDREGHNQAVYYECEGGNPDFLDLIEDAGFDSRWGTFSDISIIMSEYLVCGANLSAGYYQQHTKQERLNYTQLYHTIQQMKPLIESAGNYNVFKFEDYVLSTGVSKYYEDYQWESGYAHENLDPNYAPPVDETGVCASCEYSEDGLCDICEAEFDGEKKCRRCGEGLVTITEKEYQHCLNCMGGWNK